MEGEREGPAVIIAGGGCPLTLLIQRRWPIVALSYQMLTVSAATRYQAMKTVHMAAPK